MFEWVHETAPTLRAAIDADVIAVPLLVLDRAQWQPAAAPAGVTLQMLDAEDLALTAALGVEHVAFGAPGTTPGPQAISERDVYEVDAARLEYMRERIRRGTSVTAVAEHAYGPIAVGTLRPVGTVA